jgi:hypothetical protein
MEVVLEQYTEDGKKVKVMTMTYSKASHMLDGYK